MGIATPLKKNNVVVCTPIESKGIEDMKILIDEAKSEGADLVHLSLDSISFSHISAIDDIINHTTLPAILSYRLNSSRTLNRGSSEKTCFQVLRRAIELGVEFVEMDFEVACDASMVEHIINKNPKTKIIVTTYVKGEKPSKEKLGNVIARMQSTRPDIVKLELDVEYITDLAPVFHMLTHSQVPLIVIAAGSRGLISQLLAPKFGGFLVYGSLSEKPMPGLPSLLSLKHVYKLEHIDVDTKVFGLISNPVGHSKSPLLHNSAFRHTGYNGIYVPMQVDNINEFFETYSSNDFVGFSVGIPHKEAAVACCDEVHPLAKSIGAVNTILRRPIDGKLIGYNTDCEASMSAIEDALRERGITNGGSPLHGRTFVLVGAGGAGRALAFGAKSRGAHVVIFNRNYERAKALAKAVSGEAFPYQSLDQFCPENGMILANASAVGMEPNTNQTPISKDALKAYDLVFDAVYTPKNTKLLQDAADVGAIVVSGVEMFIRQALGQFKLFTGGLAPEDFIRKLVLEQF